MRAANFLTTRESTSKRLASRIVFFYPARIPTNPASWGGPFPPITRSPRSDWLVQHALTYPQIFANHGAKGVICQKAGGRKISV